MDNFNKKLQTFKDEDISESETNTEFNVLRSAIDPQNIEEPEEELQDAQDDEEEDVDDKCYFNYADDPEEDDDIELSEQDEFEEKPQYVIVPKQDRITKPILFKYERVRLIGTRTKQLSLGAKPMIKNVEHLTPKQIALLEIEKNIIPLIIERPLPNGKFERWHIKELEH
jgi:DNA-directed RNA polymerase subunit K/omega